MLWLVTGVSSFGSSTSSVTPREPKEVTPPAPATDLGDESNAFKFPISHLYLKRPTHTHEGLRTEFA